MCVYVCVYIRSSHIYKQNKYTQKVTERKKLLLSNDTNDTDVQPDVNSHDKKPY